ncbi:hypothetical protein HD806DRAFT_494208 [Xylariaceae sp. AK1471]|nr:hypothetical protein HD806DRAFT_494208 [Xylariaceae sp. AK1471]
MPHTWGTISVHNTHAVLRSHSLLALVSFLIIIQIGLTNPATIAERSSFALSWLVRRPGLSQTSKMVLWPQ